MTTTQHRRVHKMRTRLMVGFETLTLDPSPRLRQRRQELSRTDRFVEAWQTVSEGFKIAIRLITDELRASK